MAGEDWTAPEIDAAVADYFAMLTDDIAGISYNKAAHNRGLQKRIGRGRGSIEFKHQNISAVLLGLGQPWIPGYKPAANFQNALVDGVLRWLDCNEDWLAQQANQSRLRDPAATNWIGPPNEGLLEFGPVPSQRNEPPPVDAEFMARIGLKYDVAERDARNRAWAKPAKRKCLRTSEHGWHQREGLTSLAKCVGRRWRTEMVMAMTFPASRLMAQSGYWK